MRTIVIVLHVLSWQIRSGCLSQELTHAERLCAHQPTPEDDALLHSIFGSKLDIHKGLTHFVSPVPQTVMPLEPDIPLLVEFKTQSLSRYMKAHRTEPEQKCRVFLASASITWETRERELQLACVSNYLNEGFFFSDLPVLLNTVLVNRDGSFFGKGASKGEDFHPTRFTHLIRIWVGLVCASDTELAVQDPPSRGVQAIWTYTDNILMSNFLHTHASLASFSPAAASAHAKSYASYLNEQFSGTKDGELSAGGCGDQKGNTMLRLVKLLRPEDIIFEFGTFRGRSTLALATEAPHGNTVVTLDINQSCHHNGYGTGRQGCYGEYKLGEVYLQAPSMVQRQIIQWVGRSSQMDYQLLFGRVGFVWLDGSHAEEDVYGDFVAAWLMSRSGGVIMLDDFRPQHWGVHKAMRKLRWRFGPHFHRFELALQDGTPEFCDYVVFQKP